MKTKSLLVFHCLLILDVGIRGQTPLANSSSYLFKLPPPLGGGKLIIPSAGFSQI
jgi:hypothetical protein